MSLSDTVTTTIGAADPTGVVDAAGAAVKLVGTVLRTVPALQNATHAIRDHSSLSSGTPTLHRAQTAVSAAEVAVDPERERRAYETVNFVLRELGSRICAAGLVNEHCLSRALTSAAQHIDFKLFSGDANRLFASLAPKLEDPMLVNNVFASIYFVGALTAELSRSLPNYKESYVPLGPRIVQQLFRTAIGEDAFRENLTSNLDAYKTLATTAGLLRPTDIGYSVFPGFPAFSPCRYSSRSYGDVRNNKTVYEKLTKHFDKFGFPQPILACQAEVGKIKEWRFIAGDAPSRTVEVERADKNIGESFGRFLHWLICSADRLPPGQAVIAYYDQHIELVRWVGQRMGYRVLSAKVELDWSGNHLQLDRRARAITDSWVVLMPSEKAQAERRASSAHWTQTHMVIKAQHTPAQTSQQQPEVKPDGAAASYQAQGGGALPPIVPPISPPQAPSTSSQVTGSQVPSRNPSNAKTLNQRLDEVERDFNNVLLPQCNKFLTMPSYDHKTRDAEYRRLTQVIDKGLIHWLDGLAIPEDNPARMRRKAMVVHAHQVLEALDRAPKSASPGSGVVEVPSPAAELTGSAPEVATAVPQAVATTPPSHGTTRSHPQTTPIVSPSPPPYSPASPSPASSSTMTSASPLIQKPPLQPVVRRRAPPPPKKFVTAKALYDFQPEAGNEEELAIKEDDEIEVIEKTATLEEEGWCRARIKGAQKIGLVPLEYLEIEQMTPAAAQAPATTPVNTPQLATTSHTPASATFAQGSHTSYGGALPSSVNPVAPTQVLAAIPVTTPKLATTSHTPASAPFAQGSHTSYAGASPSSVNPVAPTRVSYPTTYSTSAPIYPQSNYTAQPAEATTNPQSPFRGDQVNTTANPIPYQDNQNNNSLDNGSSVNNTSLSAPNDIGLPRSETNPLTSSSPPFEPDTLASGPGSGSAMGNMEPYSDAQDIDLANTLGPDPTTETTDAQQSMMYSNIYSPPSSFTSVATADPLMTNFAPDYYSSPVTTPIASPTVLADEQMMNSIAFSQMSTEDIIDDTDEMEGAVVGAEEFDGYDPSLI